VTNGVPTTPDDLARHSVISFTGVSSPTVWTFESKGVAITGSFRSRLSVNTIDAAIDAGLCGMGLIRVNSYQVVDYVRSGRLAVVLEDFAPASRPVHLVYDKQNRLPLKLRAFVDFVVPHLRERLAQAEF
jgi:DNA-binding transcriptional LysR family regulator